MMLRKVLLAVLAAMMALLSLATIPLWFFPRRVSLEQTGGVELIYEFDPAYLPATASRADLAQRTITVLRRRIDPYGQKPLSWAIVDGSRIQIQMPLPSQKDKNELADLMRLLKGRGVLDFRVAATRGIDDNLINSALEQFRDVGPQKTVVPNMRWFEIDPKNGADLAKLSPSNVTAQAPDGTWYILCYTDWDRALTHDGIHLDWKLTRAVVDHDPAGRIIVPFSFDSLGAGYFASLTTRNVNRPMAILVDDQAISAPMINSPITGGSGEITFGDAAGSRSATEIRKDAETLVAMLEAGSLPARLKPDPVSIREIPPVPNFHPFPWPMVFTFTPLSIMLLALILLAIPGKKPPIPAK